MDYIAYINMCISTWGYGFWDTGYRWNRKDFTRSRGYPRWTTGTNSTIAFKVQVLKFIIVLIQLAQLQQPHVFKSMSAKSAHPIPRRLSSALVDSA